MSSKARDQVGDRSAANPAVTGLPRACRRRFYGLGACLIFVCGCGGTDEVRPAVHPTKGTLQINGTPAAGAMLVFHPVGDEAFDARGTRPTATVDDQGGFVLSTYQPGDGAPAGEYRVTILWFENPDSNASWEKLGGRFADPNRSDIRVTVRAGQEQLEPIRLENVQILPKPRADVPQDLDQVD